MPETLKELIPAYLPVAFAVYLAIGFGLGMYGRRYLRNRGNAGISPSQVGFFKPWAIYRRMFFDEPPSGPDPALLVWQRRGRLFYRTAMLLGYATGAWAILSFLIAFGHI